MKKHTRSKHREDWAKSWRPENALTVNALDDVARPEYVAWIDLMGAKSWMAGSIRRAAEIIGLVHLAGPRAAKKESVKAYPVIDGVYLVGENKGAFREASQATMRMLALTFMDRKSPDRFLVRGGIAYGRVLHGDSIAALHDDLKDAASYSASLALGISIGQAYTAESKSPPFGFYVDMTARSTASVNDAPYVSSYYRWWSPGRPEEKRIADDFGAALLAHFKYLSARYREIEYPLTG